MYSYLLNKELRNELRAYCEEKIFLLQKEVSKYFTFSFKLIGSGDNRLMTINGNKKSIDLDYNIVIQRDKKQLVGKPEQIKKIFMRVFKDVCGRDTKVSDSTQVITCKVGKIDGYDFSFDIAIFVEGNDGFIYKLINDKKTMPSRYIWNRIPSSKDFNFKFSYLKRNGHWEDIKSLYLKKKNLYLTRGSDKTSFSILIETVNEIIQKME
jgi:hypothetical protein